MPPVGIQINQDSLILYYFYDSFAACHELASCESFAMNPIHWLRFYITVVKRIMHGRKKTKLVWVDKKNTRTRMFRIVPSINQQSAK